MLRCQYMCPKSLRWRHTKRVELWLRYAQPRFSLIASIVLRNATAVLVHAHIDANTAPVY